MSSEMSRSRRTSAGWSSARLSGIGRVAFARGAVDELELLGALERARELHSDLAGIVAWLERRLDARKH